MHDDLLSSRLEGFYRKPLGERSNLIAEWAGLDEAEQRVLHSSLSPVRAERMIENVVGVFAIPFGVAVNFLVNGQDYLVPMAIEEPSVVAGASFAARLVREGGGFGPTPLLRT